MMIESVFDDAEIGDVLSTTFGEKMEYNWREQVREAKRDNFMVN